ncbi:MAG: SDR family oxidoreductase [Paracoccaceae bacterium]|nr:SDR family oxidoreductase [Paracoccaceae bacterium]
MKNVFITGTNRGLGLELVRQYLKNGRKVFATCRDIRVASELVSLQKESDGMLEILDLNLFSDDSINKLSEMLSDSPIDLFVNNAGMMGPRNLQLGGVNGGSWAEVFRVNTIAPLLIVQNLLENISSGKEKKMIFISSRVGSIEENSGGAMYAYRSSKTALNQVVKSLSIDLLDRGLTSVALHPGWVLTDMGGPNALIDVETSVAGMISVINGICNSDNGKFFNYDGSMIRW